VAWLDCLSDERYPAVAVEQLARFADVFGEPGVFSAPETRRLLELARRHGMALKLHADELHDGGAGGRAAEMGATSADHLAAISPEGVAALAPSSTVAPCFRRRCCVRERGDRRRPER
jgi:imidazolonepropionase